MELDVVAQVEGPSQSVFGELPALGEIGDIFTIGILSDEGCIEPLPDDKGIVSSGGLVQIQRGYVGGKGDTQGASHHGICAGCLLHCGRSDRGAGRGQNEHKQRGEGEQKSLGHRVPPDSCVTRELPDAVKNVQWKTVHWRLLSSSRVQGLEQLRSTYFGDDRLFS